MLQARNEISFNRTASQSPTSNVSMAELSGLPAEIGISSPVTQSSKSKDSGDIGSFERSCLERDNDVLSTYLHQIGNIPRLTSAEEFGLFVKLEKSRKQIEEHCCEFSRHLPNVNPGKPPSVAVLAAQLRGAKLARSSRAHLSNLVRQVQVSEENICTVKNRIVEANLRLAVCIAKKYRRRGLDLLDLIQEANIGLMSAIDRFDYRRNVKFSVYASWWVQQAIGCGINNHGRTIRLPVHVLETCRKVEHAKMSFQQEGIDEPSLAQLAEVSGLTIEKIAQSVQLTPCGIALDSYMGMDSCDAIQETIACEKTPNPLMEAIGQEIIEEIRAVVTTLPPREKQIADLRYGLQDGDERSLQEVGTLLNLSRERIRQLESRFLNRLRHPSRSEKLREFLDV